MNNNALKLLAIVGTGLGFTATLITNYANTKEQEIFIEEKIDEALDKREKERENEIES